MSKLPVFQPIKPLVFRAKPETVLMILRDDAHIQTGAGSGNFCGILRLILDSGQHSESLLAKPQLAIMVFIHCQDNPTDLGSIRNTFKMVMHQLEQTAPGTCPN